MEIEKKFLVELLPENLADYDVWEIEQYYLCAEPTIRIRKKNDQYILTYKSHVPMTEDSLCVAEETELPLTEEAFSHLREKCDGQGIIKTRYRLPYRQWTIELDVFHGKYDGFYLAEVEFATVEESRTFTPPDWFGREVSGDYHYANSYLAGLHLQK